MATIDLKWQDFDAQEATQIAQELIKENQRAHNHSFEFHPCVPHESMPMLTRYYYVKSPGVRYSTCLEDKKLFGQHEGGERASNFIAGDRRLGKK